MSHFGHRREIAVYLAVAVDVFNGVSLCCPFSHGMSWMRSGTLKIQFLYSYLLFLSCVRCKILICATDVRQCLQKRSLTTIGYILTLL